MDTVRGVIAAADPAGADAWAVRLGAAGGGPWFTVRRADLPAGIDRPEPGDVVTVTIPRLVGLERLTAAVGELRDAKIGRLT